MRKLKTLAVCLAVHSIAPQAAVSETYKESFECTFSRGLAVRPTPRRVVFSVEKYGRSALLHEVEIPEIDTPVRSARVRRNSIRVLSISWPGDEYTFTASGKNVTTNTTRAFNLRKQEFSLFFDRRTKKAIARSKTSDTLSKDGNAEGTCAAIAAPK